MTSNVFWLILNVLESPRTSKHINKIVYHCEYDPGSKSANLLLVTVVDPQVLNPDCTWMTKDIRLLVVTVDTNSNSTEAQDTFLTEAMQACSRLKIRRHGIC